jgi:hypothetical protein
MTAPEPKPLSKLAPDGERRAQRGALFASLLITLVVALGRSAPTLASDSTVPANLQAELIAKLGTYDRNFARRAGEVAQVLIVIRKGNPRSEVSAATIRSALARVDRIGGLSHEETIVEFSTAAAIAKRCRDEGAAILYVTPGLDAEVANLRAALSGVSVLSVSAIPELVPKGIVLGFELVSGKPKIVLNLPQARRQDVDFEAGVLKLMKVYR